MVIDKRQRLGRKRMTFKIIIKTFETILIRLKAIYIYIYIRSSFNKFDIIFNRY